MMEIALPRLECGGCRKCCEGDAVPYSTQDNGKGLEVEVRDGRWVIAHKDGQCVYLAPTGCSTYHNQPHRCQVFDCRLYAMQMDAHAKAGATETDRARSRVILEGRRRLSIDLQLTASVV